MKAHAGATPECGIILPLITDVHSGSMSVTETKLILEILRVPSCPWWFKSSNYGDGTSQKNRHPRS
jgi:hypothetical protein